MGRDKRQKVGEVPIATLPNARRILEELLSSPRGFLKVTFKDENQAFAMRHRMYRVRSDHRKQSRKSYSPDDPRHDVSPWDNIQIELVDNILKLRLDPDIPSQLNISYDEDEEDDEDQTMEEPNHSRTKP